MPSVTRRAPDGANRREAVEQRVLRAVEQLLEDGRSFVELSVQEVADAAGVARSTFYVHFADKSELLVRLAEASTADMLGEGERWVTGDHAGGRAELREVCRRIVAHYREHRPLLQAVGAATTYDPVMSRWWVGRVERFIDLCEARVRELARDQGRDPAGARATAAMVGWSIERTVSMSVLLEAPEGDDQLADVLARGVWLLLYGPA